MTLSPQPGASGSAVITLTANDGEADSQPVSFRLTVNPTGGTGPSDILITGPDGLRPVIDENSPAGTLVGKLSAVDPDDTEGILFALVDSAGGRFRLGGKFGEQLLVADGSLLDFEAAPDHRIRVRATDPAGDSYEKILGIGVANVNEPPVIAVPAAVEIAAESTGPVNGVALDDPDAGPSELAVNLVASAGSLHLDDSGPLAGKVTGNDSAEVMVLAPQAELNGVLSAGGLVFSAVGVEENSVSLTVKASDGGASGSGGEQSSSAGIEIRVRRSPFEEWRRDWFDAAQLADPEVSGALGDGDRNGILNLAEYGVGANPLDPTEGPRIVEFIEVSDGGLVYPAVRFRRLKQALDPSLEIQVELATDDFNWRSGAGATVAVSSEPLDDRLDRLVVRSAVSRDDSRLQLLRLRFRLAAPAR
jgi:hypothetical protein